MKNQQQQRGQRPSLPVKQQQRPENKDNLDHRSGEEQNSKGDRQTTHNKREHHGPNKNEHRKEEKGRQ